MLSLRTINAMSEAEFVESFSSLYESSPWVAVRTFQKKPFHNALELQMALRQTVEDASTTEQNTLIRAHPDLAGKLARTSALTVESTREQSRLGLDELSEAEYATFDLLNQSYKERFQFPFVICVGMLQDRSQILDAFRSRLTHSFNDERQEALHQIHLIAQLRLAAKVETIPSL